MSYQAAKQQQNSTATRAERSAMQPCATATAAEMPMISLKTDQLLGLFLLWVQTLLAYSIVTRFNGVIGELITLRTLLVVVVINMLLLSSGSGGG